MKTIVGDYGTITVDEFGDIIEVERGRTEQGFVYKNEKAFDEKIGVCYIPELSDSFYTYDNILEICDYNHDMAKLVFDDVDWQHPESRYDELLTYESESL